MSLAEVRCDPRTGIFWQEVEVRGSVVTITDGSEGGTPRQVSYAMWHCWDRLPQTIGDNGGAGAPSTSTGPQS